MTGQARGKAEREPMRPNPKKLNALQLKTLAILQAMAGDSAFADEPAEDGTIAIHGMPHAHGDHFHIGRAVVSGRDATGLGNPNVISALLRKGLLVSRPGRLVLTTDALAYETGVAARILHRPDH
jgi:hypothetical protein